MHRRGNTGNIAFQNKVTVLLTRVRCGQMGAFEKFFEAFFKVAKVKSAQKWALFRINPKMGAFQSKVLVPL